jgi:hypothetical protein
MNGADRDATADQLLDLSAATQTAASWIRATVRPAAARVARRTGSANLIEGGAMLRLAELAEATLTELSDWTLDAARRMAATTTPAELAELAELAHAAAVVAAELGEAEQLAGVQAGAVASGLHALRAAGLTPAEVAELYARWQARRETWESGCADPLDDLAGQSARMQEL